MSQNTIVVPRGGEYKILLEDSTVIHLGPESSLSVPYNFSKTNRTVKISGEAYLIVHGDSLYPFNIEMPRINIRVRGTELNIEAYENETDTHVVLVKGKAEVVSLTKEPVELSVGYTTIVSRGDSIRKVPANIPECTAWHHSRLSFEGKSLEFIMTKLERWYNVKAIFKDDLSRNLCITMNVDKYDTFNNLANSIRKMNELQIEIKKGNTVYVSANNYKSQ